MMKPGRELDALVAEKVLGWALQAEPYTVWLAPDADRIHTPAFSTDIAAAWQVIEALERREWYARVGHYQLKPVQWNCRLVPATATEAYVFADAPTVPHAICLAALKVVGIEV